MAEYIERAQAKEELLSWARCIKHPEHLLTEDAMCVLDSIPAADVVEVPCHCKDCKHWKHIEHVGCSDYAKVCMLANYMIGPMGYCLYGERMDGEG